ncbi:MAG: cbb3-type cytochrome oxidase assembly protein CcoS [Pseudomonadaceae bacterium]|nr:cbb3-type cytochrome oxidase assembly protein CcoS [Pseudomonadaceae bacterium]
MQAMLLLILISFAIMSVAGLCFLWAVKSRQFDDMDRGALIALREASDETRQSKTPSTDNEE